MRGVAEIAVTCLSILLHVGRIICTIGGFVMIGVAAWLGQADLLWWTLRLWGGMFVFIALAAVSDHILLSISPSARLDAQLRAMKKKYRQ